MMTDNRAELPSSALNDMDSLVARIRAFVVWIGGSLASITAIFYATGYLITRAHLSMLGLYGMLAFDNDYIIQEGAKFFLVVGYATVSEVALPLLALLGLAVIAAKVFQQLAGSRVQRGWARLCERLPGFGAQGWMRLLAYSALFIAFLYHAETFLPKFQAPLCIGNLLYADSGSAPCPGAMMRRGADALKAALLKRDEVLLNNAFQELEFGLALAGALAYLTWRTTLPWRWRSWYAAPSLIATALYLVLLPMDYAVLQRPIIYPRIELTFDPKLALSIPGPLFLLNESAHEFVVWDATIRKLFWIPAGSVNRAEVDGTYGLFGAGRNRSQTKGEGK